MKFEITSLEGTVHLRQVIKKFSQKNIVCEFPEFIDWSEFGKKYLKDDRLQVKCHVTIIEVTGIKKEASRKFDKSMKKFSDVILKVGGQDFYVSKLTLAIQSPYFDVLFFGGFKESKKSTVELKGLDPQNFQDYLKLIYCSKSLVSDFNLERMLELADMYDTPMVMEKCEDQMMNTKSFLSKKDKLRLVAKFKLKNAMNFLIGKCTTVEELREMVPDDNIDPLIDPKILRQVLDGFSSKGHNEEYSSLDDWSE